MILDMGELAGLEHQSMNPRNAAGRRLDWECKVTEESPTPRLLYIPIQLRIPVNWDSQSRSKANKWTRVVHVNC